MKRLSTTIFLAVGLVIVADQCGWATDYRRFGETNEGVFFYDIEGIAQHSKETVSVWIKEKFSPQGVRSLSRAQGNNYMNLDYALSQEELNCRDRTFRQLSLALYNKDETVLSSSINRIKEFEPVLPGSVEEKLLNAVCK